MSAEPVAPQNLAAEETVLGAIMLAGASGARASRPTRRRPRNRPRWGATSTAPATRSSTTPRTPPRARRADRRARPGAGAARRPS